MMYPTPSDSKPTIRPLAIVGLSLRYPDDATSSEAFWQMMTERRCASSKFPADRLNVSAHHHPDTSRQDSLSMDGAHFISGDLGAFDAGFFSIPAAEAEAMDPQQRLVLETSYHALENAGISLDKASGSQMCVFTGCSANDYATMYSKDPQRGSKYSVWGQSMSMVANRVSWFYNLKGPSANVDTACSSSLLALDLACQSIWNGASTTGLVVGANLLFSREYTNALDNLGVFSKDNRCFSFDERANGYSRGEGFGALVIKPVDDAIRDGDTIRAVIRSTRSNQDGRTPGITNPNREAQRTLIEESYRQAGLDPAATRYFEAHGTGTPTGDPIEMRAIGAVFKSHRSLEDPLYVGSVKSNIGHLEGGSGVAGVIKVVLAMEKGIIPPVSENFKSLNPKIDLEYLNMKVVTESIPWPSGLRRASVNSFGFGGANSHAILDDALSFLEQAGLTGNHNTLKGISDSVLVNGNGALTNGFHQTNSYYVNGSGTTLLSPKTNGINGVTHHASQPKILTWSASDESGIERLSQSWHDYLQTLSLESDELERHLDSLAHTLNQRRSRLPWTAYTVFDPNTNNVTDIAAKWSSPIRLQDSHRIAFVFSGQGAQWPTMGRELITRYPAFRNSLYEAGDYLRSLGCQWDLIDELQKQGEESSINDPTRAQPLCTALQVALVDLLTTFELKPTAVVGHSSGEIGAAYCTGAISRGYAWRLSYFRGVWAARLATSSSMNGTMMAVALPEEKVQSFLSRLSANGEALRVVIACINSPKSVTLSGQRNQIKQLHGWFREESIMARILPIPVAYHSFQMEEIAISYKASVGDDPRQHDGQQDPSAPRMVSSVNGQWVSRDRLCTAEYWVVNLISPVRFLDAVRRLSANPSDRPTKKLDGSHQNTMAVDAVLEIGPHAAMRGPCRDIFLGAGRGSSATYLSMLMRNTCAVQTTLDTMAQLHCLGYSMELDVVNNPSQRSGKVKPKVLVDLPQYAFNHTKSYWREGPISKGFRFRRFGRHEILGWPDDDWNPLQPKWSNLIQPSDPVWVKDHRISNTTILPGASMLSMAIEAAKQVTDPNAVITGFEFKNVKFMSALVVPADGPGVDTRFFMRPLADDDQEKGGWFDFSLCSHQQGAWIKNSTGTIQAVTEKREAENIDGGRVAEIEVAEKLHHFSDMSHRCTTPLSTDHFYGSLESFGCQFGPTFTPIADITTDEVDHLVANVRTYATEAATNWHETYTIHPTTLDGLMQSALLLSSQGGQKQVPVAIPARLERAWVSNGGLSQPTTDSIYVGTKLCHEGRQESSYNIMAVGQSKQDLLINIEGVTFAAVDSQHSARANEEDIQASVCHRTEWKPDLDVIKKEEIYQFCQVAASVSNTSSILCMNRDLLITSFISRVVDAISKRDEVVNSTDATMQSYIDWMKSENEATLSGDSPFGSKYWQKKIHDDLLFDDLCSTIEETGKQGEILVQVGKSLMRYARGEQLSSQLLDRELLCTSYEELLNEAPGLRRWRTYVDVLAHKNPGMKILEVDGGAGSVYPLLMDTLAVKSDDGYISPRFAQLDLTDSDVDRFPARLGDCGPLVAFRDLDIEGDVDSDGYDFIIVCLATHGFTSIDKALANIRNMLKPQGKLAIIDVANASSSRTTFLNGLRERWWISTDDYRRNGRCTDESEWNDILSQNRFSGSDLVFRDYDDETSHEISVIMSTAIDPSTATENIEHPQLAILLDPAAHAQQALADELSGRLQTVSSGAVEHWSINQVLPVSASTEVVCIVLLEMANPVLAEMDSNIFQKLKELASGPRKILWVNSGAAAKSSPFFRTADGLFRVLNSEDSRRLFTTLSVEDTPAQGERIVQVTQALICSATPEQEYIEKSGTLHIPRLVEAPSVSGEVSRLQSSERRVQQKWNSGPALKLALASPGLLDGLHFVEDTDRKSPLPPDMLEIKVKAVGGNFRDVLVMLGRIDQKTVGFECAGVVTRIGENVTNFEVGDHVTGCEFDIYRSYARLQESTAIKIPYGMSFAEAASIPINFATAWHAFAVIAHVQPGETVLVHSGSGGTGQAAIQVAQYLGANVIATVGSVQKKEFLMKNFGIPETHIFSSRNTRFAKGVRQVTNGQGVDVVLNSLSGENLKASWECIAPYGRFIEIGKTDIMSHNPLDMYYFVKNVTFSAIDLAMIVQERPYLIGRALRAVMPLLAKGTLRSSSPQHVYSISELEKGLRALQGGQSFGKVIFEMRDHDLVEARIAPQVSQSFDPNATYVVAGGLGGLGRGVTRWMVSRGARYLLLLSRSGAQSPDAKAFIRELAGSHVKAMAPPCDISDRSMLEAVLGEASYTMPRVKGCIQATMVLQDAMFEQMTYSQWTQATTPKIAGTWNLHELLPSGLDFFIMMSSISSIMGNRGQANYAAANSFMDGLAHYRVSHGERATSLNLGFFLSAGAVAQSSSLKSRYSSSSNLPFLPVSESELHALLSIHCDPSTPQSRPEDCQTILGLMASAKTKRNPESAYWLEKPSFRSIQAADSLVGDGAEDNAGGGKVAKSLSSANSVQEAATIITELLVSKLSKTLGSTKEELYSDKPLHSYGVDSLVAVELRNWFAKELNVDIAIFDMLGGATTAAVGALAAGRIYNKTAS